MVWFSLLLFFGLPSSAASPPVSSPNDLVDLGKLDFSIRQELRYATENNFTKKKVYPPEARCLLRRDVADALSKVQSELKLQSFGLKIYDCYRPLSVQKIFWQLVPDERYVADPNKGSRHNRGAAVDLTLVDLRSGEELEMPSAFDDFSEKAHRNSRKMSRKARKNSERLEKIMVAHGFIPMPTEWWHFDYRGWESYPLLDTPFCDFSEKTSCQAEDRPK